MQDTFLSRAFRVDSNRVAAVFSDTLRRQLVLLLSQRAHSITELAKLTGVELKRLHYHVIALEDLGLLRVKEVVKRAGRPVKKYRAVATAFFVPTALMRSGPTEQLRTELYERLTQHRDLSMEGVLFYEDETGRPIMRAVRLADNRQSMGGELWWQLNLSPKQVASLRKDIEDCVRSYQEQDANGKPYLMHFAFIERE